MADYTSERALLAMVEPTTPGDPAWLSLSLRGIPDDVIEANLDHVGYLSANIPGRPLGEHALVARIRDASSGEEVAYQLSFCDPAGQKVARTAAAPGKKTRLLRKSGSLHGLFIAHPAGTTDESVLALVEGRAEKALAAAAAGYRAAGYGGRQVLGLQPLPPGIKTVIVVPDRRPPVGIGPSMLKDVSKAEAHDRDHDLGIARLQMAGVTVLRMPDFACPCACKDTDAYLLAHGVAALREAIEAAKPAVKTVAGEALRIAAIADAAARDQAIRVAAKELGVGIRPMTAAVTKLRRSATRKQREEEASTAPTGAITRQAPYVVVHREFKARNGQTRKPGVYHEEANPDGGTSLTWVCSLLEVIGLNRDVDSEAWGILLRVTDSDGVKHEWAMPASLLAGRGDEMRGELLDLGLRISPTNAAREHLVAYVQNWVTTARYRCVDRLGWHDEVFVLPRAAFGGASGGDEVLFQYRHARDIPKFETVGTLEGWQAAVAAPAIGNSRLVLALSTAFAGPLVRLAGEESGGIHFFGPSSTGKTTALRCACSVWGIREGSWKATDNALEVVAACACDGLLPLDETGQAVPRVLAATAYMLANQAGKARMSRGGNRNRPTLNWVLLFLSTGELSLSVQLAQAGLLAQAGQQVRMIELPADAGAGLGIFEDLHGAPDGNAFSQQLREASQEHKGHAAHLFLEHLTADRTNAVAAVRATKEVWLRQHLPPDVTGQVSRVAGRFALIAAAGELATGWGVVPWPAGTANAAAAACFSAWIEHRGGTGPAEIREGLAQVRSFLERYGASRFEPAWEERAPTDPYVHDRAGFRRRADLPPEDSTRPAGALAARAQPWEYFVLPEAWRREVCAGFDPKAVARAMASRGALELGAGRNIAHRARIPGIGLRRVFYVLPAAFDENLSEQSE
jgi:putative DNA primase/helicase